MYRAFIIVLPAMILGCAIQHTPRDFFADDNPNNIRVLTELQVTTHCKGLVETKLSISRVNGFLLPYELDSGYLSVYPGHFEIEGVCSLKGKTPCEGVPVSLSKKVSLVAEVEPNKKYNLLAASDRDYTECTLKLSEAKP